MCEPKKKFWIWVDGQKKYYDYPVDPPGYSYEQLESMALMAMIEAHVRGK